MITKNVRKHIWPSGLRRQTQDLARQLSWVQISLCANIFFLIFSWLNLYIYTKIHFFFKSIYLFSHYLTIECKNVNYACMPERSKGPDLRSGEAILVSSNLTACKIFFFSIFFPQLIITLYSIIFFKQNQYLYIYESDS